MQPENKLDLLPMESTLEVASLADQQHDPSPVEQLPVALVNSPPSPAVKTSEQSETAVQQLDLPTPVPISKVRKERRRKKPSSTVSNVAEDEPTKSCKRLRLKDKEEEEGEPEKKGKEVVECEAVVVDKDSAPRVWNLRPRKVPENMQKNKQCGSPSGLKVDPKVACEKKFSICLTKKEIEEDFLLMTGRKPAQKPKKRNIEVKKQIPGLKMGSRLKSVCEETYAVREKPSTKWIRS